MANLITKTTAGYTFKATARTHAHVARTQANLRRRFPWARLEIIQPCYNEGVAASAGTHDKDCAFDVRIRGVTWWTAQRFLRYQGWAAWFRHTGTWAARSRWHIHMISIPTGLNEHPTRSQVLAAYTRIGQRVGEYIPGQIVDYYAHAYGLAGQHKSGSDPSRFPANINTFVYQGSK